MPGMPNMPPPPPPSEEPAAKRPRLETPAPPAPLQMPGAQNPPVSVTVAVPAIEGSEFPLNGQNITVSVLSSATIKEVKEAIQDAIGVPPGKCQLKDAASGSFMKDTQTLPAELRLELSMRERGGKKKA